MRGLDDSRTGLIREVFRIIDCLPLLLLSCCSILRFPMFVFSFSVVLQVVHDMCYFQRKSRFFAFLENVAHLLSPRNRQLLHYVCQDCALCLTAKL